MADDEFYLALAEAAEAAAIVFRRHAAAAAEGERAAAAADQATAVDAARRRHPLLGPRQIQIIEELEAAGPAGTSTGVISVKLGYDQPNVYLTLRGLMALGFAEKDASVRPHLYRLGSALAAGAAL